MPANTSQWGSGTSDEGFLSDLSLPLLISLFQGAYSHEMNGSELDRSLRCMFPPLLVPLFTSMIQSYLPNPQMDPVYIKHNTPALSNIGPLASTMDDDPLAVLAQAASKARGILLFLVLDHPQELLSSSSSSNETTLNTRPILELDHAIPLATTSIPSSMSAMVDNTMAASASKSTKGGGKVKI
ncbi:hypothetical protein EDD17DRAFT_1503408 [Pisolithus thermaeus]|nr:hypothetical protein EV401DRAFT_1891994 [Pisolithus croceorrhizus]KAI6168593.1 hypothetical protein EDD17DRAFT_1503408 [Pisolithus thermaeus]